MHLPKSGLRALGIAESYRGRSHSTLAGVVMRKDLRIDGFTFGTVTVGGMYATETILRMIQDLERRDLNAVLLSGCVIAWFNVIDPCRIERESALPVICVTYEASNGLLGDIRHHFPDDEVRLAAYRHLGDRQEFRLHTGPVIFLRAWGISFPDAARFCDDFTLEGKIPEPLRVARLCARNLPGDTPAPAHPDPAGTLP
jgi:hypothetical protein